MTVERDQAGRLGSKRLRHGVVWWMRIIFVALLPASIIAFASEGVVFAFIVAGMLFSVFVALAVLGAWLEGYFERYDR